jgi:hypothetical protein
MSETLEVYDKTASNFEVAEEIGVLLGLTLILALSAHCSDI